MTRRRGGGKSGRGDYDVGYGKPPVATRFVKGVSGNPNGRAKGSKNFATLLTNELRKQMVITEGGQRRSISKAAAVAMQLIYKSTSGDTRAMALLLPQLRILDAEAEQRGPSSGLGHTEDDAAVIQEFLDRLGRSGEEEP